MSLARSHLEAMSRDELVDVILDLAADVEQLRDDLDAERDARVTSQENAGKDRAAIRQELEQLRTDVEGDLQQTADILHHERSKLARRVAALEDEIGITAQDALAVAEAGEDGHQLTKLGRLLRHGPEAVSDRPTERMRRAKELVENWNRWGFVTPDGTERRLASNSHDLKTRLEDARGEKLEWTQVYRAMQLVDDWSGPNVSLEEGQGDEGKYVLVHRKRGASA